MTKVALSRIGLRSPYDVSWRVYLKSDAVFEGELIFASDVLYEPEYDLVGIANSYHHYHLYPLSQRDVQVAFNLLRSALRNHSPTAQTDATFLRDLLLAVHQGLADIDMREHATGIEKPLGIPHLQEPATDPAAVPIVRIVLVRVQGHRLSITKVGNALVYLVRQTGHELLIGHEILPVVDKSEVIRESLHGPYLTAHRPPPAIDLCEREIQPGDLIVVATDTLEEVIAGASLSDLVDTSACDPEVISRHLMNTLKSQPDRVGEHLLCNGVPGTWTDGAVAWWGAAWAVICV